MIFIHLYIFFCILGFRFGTSGIFIKTCTCVLILFALKFSCISISDTIFSIKSDYFPDQLVSSTLKPVLFIFGGDGLCPFIILARGCFDWNSSHFELRFILRKSSHNAECVVAVWSEMKMDVFVFNNKIHLILANWIPLKKCGAKGYELK